MASRLTTRGGRRVALNLPAGSGLAELGKARAEFERLHRERREADANLRALLQAREEAKQGDLELAAKAIRGGSKAPKTRQVDAVDAEIGKLEEYAAAIDTALDQCEDELVDTVEQKRAERVQELAERLADEQAEWVDLIDTCAAQLERVSTTAALARWYKDFPGPYPAFRAANIGHLNMRGTGGDVYAPAAVLRELREAFTERAATGRPPVMPAPEDGPKPLKRITSAHAAA